MGDLPFSAQLLEHAHSQDPDNIEIAQAVQNLKREEALNGAQREKWSFSRKYVLKPFSRFNIYMAVAFLTQERRMPEPFLKIGAKCLDWALEINPDSVEFTLAGWYHTIWIRPKTRHAGTQGAARDPIMPKSARAYLFLAKASIPDEACLRLSVHRLYPGFSTAANMEALRAEILKETRHPHFRKTQ